MFELSDNSELCPHTTQFNYFKILNILKISNIPVLNCQTIQNIPPILNFLKIGGVKCLTT